MPHGITLKMQAIGQDTHVPLFLITPQKDSFGRKVPIRKAVIQRSYDGSPPILIAPGNAAAILTVRVIPSTPEIRKELEHHYFGVQS
jgi:hypothetical protein